MPFGGDIFLGLNSLLLDFGLILLLFAIGLVDYKE
jgi:hypothetical protein